MEEKIEEKKVEKLKPPERGKFSHKEEPKPAERKAAPVVTQPSAILKKEEKKSMKITLKISLYSLMGIGVFLIMGAFMTPVFVFSLGFTFAAIISFLFYMFTNKKISILLRVFFSGLFGIALLFVNIMVWYITTDQKISFELLQNNLNKNGISEIFAISADKYARLFFTISMTAISVLTALAVVSFTVWLLLSMFKLMTKIVKPLLLRIAFTTGFVTLVARLIGVKFPVCLLAATGALVVTMLVFMLYLFTVKKINIAFKAMLASVTAIADGFLFYFLFEREAVIKQIGLETDKFGKFFYLYNASLISVFLVSLFVFIILVMHKHSPISLSFLVADVVFTLLSLVSFFVFNEYLIHTVSKYALCGFGFGVGVGLMWTAAWKIFGKGKKSKKNEKEANKTVTVIETSEKSEKTVKKEETPKAPLPSLNGKK